MSVVTVQSIFSLLRNGTNECLPNDVYAIKLPKHQPSKVVALSINEQRCLEAAAKTSDMINNASIIICLYTGIRIGELCGLMWQDIDFERQLRQVNRTVQRISGFSETEKTKVTCLSPKSDTTQKDIPLPDFLVEFLRECRKSVSGNYVISLNGSCIDRAANDTAQI